MQRTAAIALPSGLRAESPVQARADGFGEGPV
eukprot:CAMPEP_0195063376 /NCGR_PEP_ID=MMETSP0448-20130528/9755_1 /TAXON_ID=66468 /ORGANISM="Heterocapsa triquestra, Strain CCMP 448" /LENGTH=31 /DNA_ID= /DNA_START= /DNA_END= /DNA_ORIENTATION=